jgi:small-conductance mechanosensitive channel
MGVSKILSSFTENISYSDSGFNRAFNWLSENFGTFLFIFFVGLGTVFIARSVNRLMESNLEQMNSKLHMDITALRMFIHFIVAIIYLTGIITIIFSIPSLQSLSVALFTGAGVVGIIFGLAAQSTLSNIIAGISLAMFQPFRVGDRLDIMNEYGKVADLNLRHTVIITWDNRRLIIPNSKISNEAIINWTIEDPAIIWSIDVGISYDADIDKARKIMIEEARKHSNVMPLHKVEYSVAIPSLIKPEPHKIGIFDTSMIHAVDPDFKERGGVKVQLTDLKDFSINLRLQVWFKDRSIAHSSGCEIREAIIKRFFKEGIEIPYPYRTIIYKTDIENKKGMED